MSRYKAYPAYRDSGVEWFDSLPAQWDVKRISYISQLRSGDAIVSEQIEAEGSYAVYGGNGLRGYSSNFNLEGDYILIGRQGALCGNINYGSGKFWASEHAVVVYPLLDVDIKWLGETLRAMNLNQYNVSAAQPGLAVTNIICLKIPFPSRDEQEKIANFLDHETAKIDALIEKQQRLIELLKEKRLSLVHYATKGVPEVRLENCARLISRPISKSSEELFTPIGIYNRGRGIFHKDESLACDLGDSDFFYIKDNDLIFSGQFAWEGAVALADSNDDGCIASHRYPILTGMDNLLSTSYLWAFFTSQRGDFLLSENSRGAAGRNRPLNMNSLMKEKIPLPKLEDQLAVSKVVYQEKIISDRVATVIATLQERRTALISAAVTGKIDVRDWQAAA